MLKKYKCHSSLAYEACSRKKILFPVQNYHFFLINPNILRL